MKKTILFILCSILIAGISASCGSKTKTDEQAETTSTDTKTEAPKEKFIKLAEETNKDLPKPMPGGIRLDKAVAVSKNEYKYCYTFTQVPTVSAEEFIRNVKPMLSLALQQMKGKDIDMFKSDKMTVIYAYYLMDGTLFAETALSPEDYKK
ncbi:hypothetical protein [Prevotella sp. 10(H)]|uniref:hypothetical protein n=1 Tax=Prevotella sp. 10(H) TaxID=1158294 RepID=UPI0004A75AB1|nr:hypothetical protein [Prevotella sp. 10(H)]